MTVAITGASSGIGRATALAFARAGANVVIGARRELVLGELAGDIQALGSHALATPLDVADLGSVQHMAHKAHEAFGEIDVWVNNAGVGLFAHFHQPEIELHRRVIEVNLLGALYGASAALPDLVESHGVLVNNACAVAATGAPYASSYAAAEAGIRALSASLRQEYRTRGVDVCTVLPQATNTPFYEHAANFTGRHVVPEPAVSAEDVALAIVGLVRSPRPELFVGPDRSMLDWLRVAPPALAERVNAEEFERRRVSGSGVPLETGNLFEPVHIGAGVRGPLPREVHSHRKRGLSRLAAIGLAALTAARAR